MNRITLPEAAHEALQQAGIPSHMSDGMLEYKVPDVMNYGKNSRGERMIVGKKLGGWTSCHIINVKNFVIKLQKSRINVTEEDILLRMRVNVPDDSLTEELEVVEIAIDEEIDEVTEIAEKPRKMGRPKGSKNIVKTKLS